MGTSEVEGLTGAAVPKAQVVDDAYTEAHALGFLAGHEAGLRGEVLDESLESYLEKMETNVIWLRTLFRPDSIEP